MLISLYPSHYELALSDTQILLPFCDVLLLNDLDNSITHCQYKTSHKEQRQKHS